MCRYCSTLPPAYLFERKQRVSVSWTSFSILYPTSLLVKKNIFLNLWFAEQGHFCARQHLQHGALPGHTIRALLGGSDADPLRAGRQLTHLAPRHLADCQLEIWCELLSLSILDTEPAGRWCASPALFFLLRINNIDNRVAGNKFISKSQNHRIYCANATTNKRKFFMIQKFLTGKMESVICTWTCIWTIRLQRLILSIPFPLSALKRKSAFSSS